MPSSIDSDFYKSPLAVFYNGKRADNFVKKQLEPSFKNEYLGSWDLREGENPLPSPRERQLNRMEDKMDKLSRKIDLIFGDNIIMCGKYVILSGLLRLGDK